MEPIFVSGNYYCKLFIQNVKHFIKIVSIENSLSDPATPSPGHSFSSKCELFVEISKLITAVLRKAGYDYRLISITGTPHVPHPQTGTIHPSLLAARGAKSPPRVHSRLLFRTGDHFS
jgi:hypothetical protein